MAQIDQPYIKPLPNMTGLTKEFYDWCQKHELRFQRCKDCGAWRHVPREMCDECNSFGWEWAKSSGRGKIFTWFVAERALFPEFKDDIPFAVAVIEMDEGVRLASNVINCGPDDLKEDQPVEVVYDDVTPEVTLPKFRLISG